MMGVGVTLHVPYVYIGIINDVHNPWPWDHEPGIQWIQFWKTAITLGDFPI